MPFRRPADLDQRHRRGVAGRGLRDFLRGSAAQRGHDPRRSAQGQCRDRRPAGSRHQAILPPCATGYRDLQSGGYHRADRVGPLRVVTQPSRHAGRSRQHPVADGAQSAFSRSAGRRHRLPDLRRPWRTDGRLRQYRADSGPASGGLDRNGRADAANNGTRSSSGSARGGNALSSCAGEAPFKAPPINLCASFAAR